jgi:teichuronic acid biosynthesis glycosyltransferase TuaG
MLIVDDCSTDTTVEVAKAYANRDPRILVLQLPSRSGAAVARNRGISEAEGRYIAFLDSDDLWAEHKLETQLQFMEQERVALCYSSYGKITDTGEPLGKVIRVPAKTTYSQLLNHNVIGCLTAVYDTDQTGKVYMPDIRREDFGLWLKILKAGHIAKGINEPLAYLRVRERSSSSNKFVAARNQWLVYREIEGLSLPRSMYHFANYVVRSSRKHIG